MTALQPLGCGYGSADPPENVRENRRRRRPFDPGRTGLPLTVPDPFDRGADRLATRRWILARRASNARVTDRPGVALGRAVAIAPVPLADPPPR